MTWHLISYYLNQSGSLSSYSVTRPQWINENMQKITYPINVSSNDLCLASSNICKSQIHGKMIKYKWKRDGVQSITFKSQELQAICHNDSQHTNWMHGSGNLLDSPMCKTNRYNESTVKLNRWNQEAIGITSIQTDLTNLWFSDYLYTINDPWHIWHQS